MNKAEKVVKGITNCTKYDTHNCEGCPYAKGCDETGTIDELLLDALCILEPQVNARKPDELREWRDGYVGDCPSCGRVVRFAQKHCHNCKQLLDWSEIFTKFPMEDDDE